MPGTCTFGRNDKINYSKNKQTIQVPIINFNKTLITMNNTQR